MRNCIFPFSIRVKRCRSQERNLSDRREISILKINSASGRKKISKTSKTVRGHEKTASVAGVRMTLSITNLKSAFYSTSMEFYNINRIFCVYSSLKFISIATAMQRNFASISHKIYYFLNTKFQRG